MVSYKQSVSVFTQKRKECRTNVLNTGGTADYIQFVPKLWGELFILPNESPSPLI